MTFGNEGQKLAAKQALILLVPAWAQPVDKMVHDKSLNGCWWKFDSCDYLRLSTSVVVLNCGAICVLHELKSTRSWTLTNSRLNHKILLKGIFNWGFLLLVVCMYQVEATGKSYPIPKSTLCEFSQIPFNHTFHTHLPSYLEPISYIPTPLYYPLLSSVHDFSHTTCLIIQLILLKPVFHNPYLLPCSPLCLVN